MITLQRQSSHLIAVLTAVALAACVKSDQANQSADSTARNLTLAPTETIVAAEPAPNPNASGRLELAVQTVSVRGSSYAVDATVESKDTVMQGRGVTKGDAAKVGGGAIAGALVGKLLGKNTKGALIGGAVGAAAGAAAARASRDIDVVLPKGAAITLKLNKPLTVKRTA